MSRRRKKRCINFNHSSFYFKPSGIRLINLEEVELGIDEVEAIRLYDYEGFNQVECAKKMDISQPTFARILSGAHLKIADAILNKKALKMEIKQKKENYGT